MSAPKKTVQNPYGLTQKQRLVIHEVATRSKKGKKVNLTDITHKYYGTKNRKNAAIQSHTNMHKENFREALLEELEEKQILGKGGVVNTKLEEGLDATNKGEADYSTRLKYIQEIHKIAGVYAPQKIDKRSLTLSANVSEEELDSRIEELQGELEE